MNKQEIVTKVAMDTGLTKKDTEKAINGFLEAIGETLAKGDSVKLVGFGNFEVRHRKGRTGRNPHDPDQTFEIPARKSPIFKPGSTLKATVNSK